MAYQLKCRGSTTEHTRQILPTMALTSQKLNNACVIMRLIPTLNAAPTLVYPSFSFESHFYIARLDDLNKTWIFIIMQHGLMHCASQQGPRLKQYLTFYFNL